MRRRHFIQTAGALGASLAGTHLALAADNPLTSAYRAPVPADTGASGTVIVVGGGMAGATAAKYLRIWGGKRVNVVLIDATAGYTSNIMSNLVLTGARTLSSLNFPRDQLATRYGVQLVQGRVSAIVPAGSGPGGKVLVGGTEIAYTRLVVAPGIEFDPVPGVPDNLQGYYPHAWQAGAQTTELRRQLLAMPASSGVFLMSIPAAPYRCPPGPYERACLIADWLRSHKPGSRLVLLDANLDITAEKETFSRAFNELYADIIEYHPATMISSVQPGVAGGGTVYTEHTRAVVGADGTSSIQPSGVAGPSFDGVDVVNPITPHRAGSVLASVPGILKGGRWAPVNVLSYESSVPGIHVIGDACKTTQPKAGHIANQEAKVCADAVTRLLRGDTQLDQNLVTNSACFSPITATQASWLTAVFHYDPVSGTMKKYLRPAGSTAAGVLADGEAGQWTTENFSQMGHWFRQLMADSFA